MPALLTWPAGGLCGDPQPGMRLPKDPKTGHVRRSRPSPLGSPAWGVLSRCLPSPPSSLQLLSLAPAQLRARAPGAHTCVRKDHLGPRPPLWGHREDGGEYLRHWHHGPSLGGAGGGPEAPVADHMVRTEQEWSCLRASCFHLVSIKQELGRGQWDEGAGWRKPAASPRCLSGRCCLVGHVGAATGEGHTHSGHTTHVNPLLQQPGDCCQGVATSESPRSWRP